MIAAMTVLSIAGHASATSFSGIDVLLDLMADKTEGDETNDIVEQGIFSAKDTIIAAGKRTVTAGITSNAGPSPDFDGDDLVGFTDFLIFASAFGSRQGDARYNAAQDLNADGSIDFTDFLIFAQSFGGPPPSTGEGNGTTTVAIPDRNLRAVIEDSLGKSRGAPITQAEMATLALLAAPNRNIHDLTGLEFAVNLKWLNVGVEKVGRDLVNSNDISNLSPLSDLAGLVVLNLWGNGIRDVSALAGLTGLERLALAENNITDVSALNRMVNLTALGLFNNNISDVSALSGLARLEFLGLDNNNISDASPLSGLRGLKQLSLAENNISDVSALSNLTNLNILWLAGNNITGVSALSRFTRLEYLDLDDNSIRNLTALSGLLRLEILFLTNNRISDIAPLVANPGIGSGDYIDLTNNPLNATSVNTHIPALRHRGVDVRVGAAGSTIAIPDQNLRAVVEDSLGKSRGAPITQTEMAALIFIEAPNRNIRDLTGIEFAVSLRWLNLGGELVGRDRVNSNEIYNLAPLSGLKNLQFLLLDYNGISEVSALSGLTGLRGLILWGNRIRDVSSLSRLTWLEVLALAENRITDVSAVSGMTRLELVDLADNRVSDLSPLVENSGLGRGDKVNVNRNPLNASSINTHIPALRRRGVDVLFGASKLALRKKKPGLLHAVGEKYRSRWPEAGGITRD